MTYLHPVIIYGMKKFIQNCKSVDIAGVIIVDSNLNSPEERILINGLSKKSIGYTKIISLNLLLWP